VWGRVGTSGFIEVHTGDPCSTPSRKKNIPPPSHCPDRLWGPYTVSDLVLWQGDMRPGVKLTTHLHLVPKLRMRGVVPPHPYTSSWPGAYWSPLQCNVHLGHAQSQERREIALVPYVNWWGCYRETARRLAVLSIGKESGFEIRRLCLWMAASLLDNYINTDCVLCRGLLVPYCVHH
jgi:hypothetical protein